MLIVYQKLHWPNGNDANERNWLNRHRLKIKMRDRSTITNSIPEHQLCSGGHDEIMARSMNGSLQTVTHVKKNNVGVVISEDRALNALCIHQEQDKARETTHVRGKGKATENENVPPMDISVCRGSKVMSDIIIFGKVRNIYSSVYPYQRFHSFNRIDFLLQCMWFFSMFDRRIYTCTRP
ncbi:hypothetical protein Dimus_038276 [Dionaea muscipula]